MTEYIHQETMSQMPYNVPPERVLASIGSRLVAHILHGLIPAFLIILLGIGVYIAYVSGVVSEEQSIGVASVLLFLTVLVFIIIDINLMIHRSQTIGKYLLNIVVVDDRSFERISFRQNLFLRIIAGKYLCIIGALFLGNLWGIIDSLFIFSKDARTVHDRIANTLVFDLPEQYKRKGFFTIDSLPNNMSYGHEKNISQT